MISFLHNIMSKPHLHSSGALTVTGGQGVTPKVVLLANQQLIVAQPVSCVALEGHRGADGQVMAQPDAVHWDTRVHTGVCVQGDHWGGKNVHCHLKCFS